MEKIVSIDIGGTAIKYALMDENANIIEKNIMDTEANKGGNAVLDKAINIVKEFQKREKISGVTISTAGMVDSEKGEIIYLQTIPNCNGINFKKAFKERLNLKCEIENDVNCAGLAEYISGASKNSKIAVMLTVGTGIGGSIIIDGKTINGFSNGAGEVGYMYVGDEQLQDVASTRALVKKVAYRKKEDQKDWNGVKVFEEAEKGDEICINTINEMVEILGKYIANICYVINPEIIVLGGGIMEREAYLESKITNAVKNNLIPPFADHTTIKFAKHKNDAGLLGAFYNYKNKII